MMPPNLRPPASPDSPALVDIGEKALANAFTWWEYAKVGDSKFFHFADKDQMMAKRMTSQKRDRFKLGQGLFEVSIEWIAKGGKVKPVQGQDNVYIIREGSETLLRPPGTKYRVRECALVGSDVRAAAPASKDEAPTPQPLRRRVTSLVRSMLLKGGGNVIDTILKRTNKKKSAYDIRVWIQLREMSFDRTSPFRRIQFAETNELIKYLGPEDLAHFQMTCRLFYLVGEKEETWNRLCDWRKSHPRERTFASLYWHRNMKGKAFFVREFAEKAKFDRAAELRTYERRVKNARLCCIHPAKLFCDEDCLDELTTLDDPKITRPTTLCAMFTLLCFFVSLIGTIPLVFLIPARAEMYDSVEILNATSNVSTTYSVPSDADWSPYLTPTYFWVIALLSGAFSCFCSTCNPKATDDLNLEGSSWLKFFAQVLLQHSFRVFTLALIVCVPWFAANIAYIGDADDDAPDTWKDAFFPLWIAEGSVIFYLFLAILFETVWRDSSDDTFFESFVFNIEPWKEFCDNDSSRTLICALFMYAVVYMPCIAAFSYLLPSKLDDDDSHSWNIVFVPLWTMYGVNCILTPILNAYLTPSGEPVTVLAIINSIINCFAIVMFALINAKSNDVDAVSWTQVMIPWYIFFGCTTTLGLILLLIACNN